LFFCEIRILASFPLMRADERVQDEKPDLQRIFYNFLGKSVCGLIDIGENWRIVRVPNNVNVDPALGSDQRKRRRLIEALGRSRTKKGFQ